MTSDIQFQLVKLGLTTPKAVEKINRKKNFEETLKRVSKKISSGRASQRDFAFYAKLKKIAPRNLKFNY